MQASFANNGVIAKEIVGFSARTSQVEMATAIARLQEKEALIVEAGTGTGKTFAYLVPSILSGKKTIISTASKALQDQLFNKDLPIMLKALKKPMSVSLLKGRDNYLCIERFNRFFDSIKDQDPRKIPNLKEIREIARFKASTQTGDLNECGNIYEQSIFKSSIISNSDNCLGKKCKHYTDCFVTKARTKALDADLVVVNHSLFCADMAVKEEQKTEILPDADYIIFDEAHHLPETALKFFDEFFSSSKINAICSDIELLFRTEMSDAKELELQAQHMKQKVADFRLYLGADVKDEIKILFSHQNIFDKFKELNQAVENLLKFAKVHQKRNETIDKIIDRINEMLNITKVFINYTEFNDKNYTLWYEAKKTYFSFHISPLDIRNKFKNWQSQSDARWVFTSATLESNGNFKHFDYKIGMNELNHLQLDSPFDYQNQALLCVPRFLPDPNSPTFAIDIAPRLKEVILANKGRCFLLCTSYKNVINFEQYFSQDSHLNVFTQGNDSKSQLLTDFLSHKNALLIATQSFWEGIDVKGDDLNLVIIDKLPFVMPDDPIYKAQIEKCQANGGNPFIHMTLPSAIITLKQGVGRLIRDSSDKGAVIICDNRLVHKNYGKNFLQSLPNFQKTRSLKKTISFLTQKS